MENRLKNLEEKVDRLETIIYTLLKSSLAREAERRRKAKEEAEKLEIYDTRNSGS